LEQAADWLEPETAADEPAPPADAPHGRATLPTYSPDELLALHAALERHGGNLTKAASDLGITRPKAYRMLRSAKS
jgi:transcriptional regulator with PAS, ATPase and Fis domain